MTLHLAACAAMGIIFGGVPAYARLVPRLVRDINATSCAVADVVANGPCDADPQELTPH